MEANTPLAAAHKLGMKTAGVPLKTWQWAGVTCFQLVYSSINTGMGLFVLPTEAERLNAENGSLWVGVYLAVCGVTQLACPLAGKFSDRHASRWGRRRPFIVAGTALAVASFGAMWCASVFNCRVAFLMSLFPAQLALNVVFSSQSALPADLQAGIDEQAAESSKGIVSGIVALHSFLGSLLAMSLLVATRNMTVQVEYPLYMISLAIACGVVCWSAQERPAIPRHGGPPLTLREVAGSFWIDVRDDWDFFWVCVGRLFYYISTSVVVFMYYYLRDMMHVADEATRRSHLGTIVISAQLVGALFTVPLSRLSNTVGRKPVIYGACAIMTKTFALYALAPQLSLDASWALVMFATFSYGVGSGAYLSIDYALALDCMPIRKSSAEAFGVWGIAGFIGSTVGPVVGGGLLALDTHRAGPSLGPAAQVEEYGCVGYTMVMLILGCCMNGLVVLATAQIRAGGGKLLLP